MSKKLSPAIPRKQIEEPKQTDPKKIKKVIALSAISLVVVLALIWAVVGAVSASSLLNPERRELVYFDGPNELGMVYDFFQIKDFHGDDYIVGWFIPSQDHYGEYTNSDKTVIMSHNYQSNREMTEIDGLYLIHDLVLSGYNVITFDYTGSGNSKGKNYTFGAQEHEELSLVIDYAVNELGQNKIALMGFAFGAAPAITVGCEDARIDVVIADSPYLDLGSYLDNNISVWTQLPDLLFSSYVKTLLPVFAGTALESSPVLSVSKTSEKSFLFLHGEKDNVFPHENSRTLASIALEAGNVAEYKIFTDVPHLLGYVYAEDDYVQTVLTFLSENLK